MNFPIALVCLYATVALCADYAPFHIPYLLTHHPTGDPEAPVDYFAIEFNVTSTNGNTPQSAYCYRSWSPNDPKCTNCEPYSTYVPVGYWIDCAPDASVLLETSGISFMLYAPFSISDLSISLMQNFTNGADQVFTYSAPYHITDAAPATFACDIDCATPPSSPGFTLPVTSSSPACTYSVWVNLTFSVQERTIWGDEIYVVGDHEALGNWDPNFKGVHLNASLYDNINNLWVGGNLCLSEGVLVEYKYIQWNADGSLLWECGENRVLSVSEYSCGEQAVSDTPEYFRCGNH